MSDTATTTETVLPAGSQPAAKVGITAAEAASRFAKNREMTGEQNPKKNDVSEAARKLGQQSAQARQARQAEATANQAEEASDTVEATGDDETVHDDSHLTADDDGTGEATEESHEDNSEVDLGEGVKLPKTEIRESLLRQADYTRKTMALADQTKAFEADRAARLPVLDTLIGEFAKLIGQPMSMRQHLEADPVNGQYNYAVQQEQMEQLNTALNVRKADEIQHGRRAKEAAVAALREKHGDKAEGYYTEAVEYVAKGTGFPAELLQAQMAHPEVARLVHQAKRMDALDAQKGNVTKMVAGKPAVIKPGAKVSTQGSNFSKVQNAESRLKSSNKLADAVAVLQARRAAAR